MERQYGNSYRHLFGIGTLLLCLLLLLPLFRSFPSGAQAQPAGDTGKEEFESRILNFFDALAKGAAASAFNELRRSSPLGSPDADERAAEFQRSVDELERQYGTILHWEKLDTTKRIGNNIALVRYVLMYDQHPVIWTFTFYRKPPLTPGAAVPNPNPWVLIELHFETNIKSLL